MWWENGVIPPPHRTVFRRADAGRHASLTCAIFFPIPASSSSHALFPHAHPFSSPIRTSLQHALLFTIVSLHHRFFFSIFLNSYLCFLGLGPNSNLSLSLSAATCSQRSSSQEPQQKRSFVSCKCVNCVFHHTVRHAVARRRPPATVAVRHAVAQHRLPATVAVRHAVASSSCPPATVAIRHAVARRPPSRRASWSLSQSAP